MVPVQIRIMSVTVLTNAKSKGVFSTKAHMGMIFNWGPLDGLIITRGFCSPPMFANCIASSAKQDQLFEVQIGMQAKLEYSSSFTGLDVRGHAEMSVCVCARAQLFSWYHFWRWFKGNQRNTKAHVWWVPDSTQNQISIQSTGGSDSCSASIAGHSKQDMRIRLDPER